MIEITKIYKGTLPRVPFPKMAQAILGIKYELSLVFTNDKLSEKLHVERQGKKGPANILSFPLDRKTGEIFMNPNTIKKEAKNFGYSVKDFYAFLFIHGCLHLLGHDHGPKMESLESKWCKKFGIDTK
jgi:probable rRNA maturation factor